MALLYDPSLWASREKLTYRPSSRLLKAELTMSFEKTGIDSARLSTEGELKIPFKGEQRRAYESPVAPEMTAEGCDIVYLPILLRTLLREAGEKNLTLTLGGKPATLRLMPDGAPLNGVQTYDVSLESARIPQILGTKLLWDIAGGVMKELRVQAPIVGAVSIQLVEHSKI